MPISLPRNQGNVAFVRSVQPVLWYLLSSRVRWTHGFAACCCSAICIAQGHRLTVERRGRDDEVQMFIGYCRVSLLLSDSPMSAEALVPNLNTRCRLAMIFGTWLESRPSATFIISEQQLFAPSVRTCQTCTYGLPSRFVSSKTVSTQLRIFRPGQARAGMNFRQNLGMVCDWFVSPFGWEPDPQCICVKISVNVPLYGKRKLLERRSRFLMDLPGKS